MPLLKYSLQRLLVLVAVGGLAYAIGMRGMLLVLVAFIASGLISFFLLSSTRTQAGLEIGGFFHRLNARIDAAASAEDDEDPAQPAAQTVPAEGPGEAERAS